MVNPRLSIKSRERGASEIFILILMTSILAFTGLVYDAGMTFNARRQAANIAASAARSGVNTVSTDALYGQNLPILADDAESVAIDAALDAGVADVVAFRDGDFELVVQTELEHETTFLQIIGISSFTVKGEASALIEHRDS